MGVIEVSSMAKSYGRLAVLRNIALEVDGGETVAVLAPNGAGKTTLMKILDGSIRPSTGEVRVLGRDPVAAGRSWRKQLGIVAQQPAADPRSTVHDAVAQRAACYPHPWRTRKVLELVGLADRGGQPVATLSDGELRRLDLALGVVGRTQLLLLDQPTAGFDPAFREVAWHLLRQLARAGAAVVLTTRCPREAEALGDRVLVLSHGAVVADDDPRRLVERHGPVVVRFELPERFDGAVLPVPAIRRDRYWELHTHTSTRDIAVLCAWALDRRVELPAVQIVRPSLEDAYRTLVGEVGDDEELDHNPRPWTRVAAG